MERKFGPYTLIHQIAVGGMAEIHLARTEGIAGFEKYVAIKMIHPNFSEDQQFVQMLIDEAKITVQLAHVNIAQTFDLGRVGNTYYITMEFVEGCDLYKLLREGSELDIDVPIDVAAHIVKEAATGLDYAHRKRDVMGQPLKIVHRDVSPQNLLVSSMGEVKVIDFGIAKATMRAQETQAGVIKGKYYYMSPEQAWGEHLDSRTDIFSLGIILYELLTGQMLYLEEDLHVLLDRIREAKIEPPTTLRRDIPPELEDIVMRALSKRPNDRFSTGAEMAQAIERFLRNFSPVCGANTVTEWTKQVLGDPDEQVEKDEPSIDERDMKALTQGIGSEQLLHQEDEFSDENSIIFRASEVDERMRAAEAENDEDDDDDERDIDQQTGVVDPGTSPPEYDEPALDDPEFLDRDIADHTQALTSRAPTLGDNTPLPELYPAEGEEGEDRTVVSGPPGFGGGMLGGLGKLGTVTKPRPVPRAKPPAPKPKLGARASHKPTPLSNNADDFDAEATLAHSGNPSSVPSPKGAPLRPPAKKSSQNDEATSDQEPTMAHAHPGPFRKSNALNTANPKPAVSALKPPRKSRRTPPKGVPAQGGGQAPNSVLSHLITNSNNRAQVALSSGQQPAAIGVPLKQPTTPLPAQPGPYAGQPGMQQPGMQQPGMQQPGMQQPGMQQPGMQQQGMQQQGMQQPGMQQQGMQQPGMQQQYQQQPGMAPQYAQQQGMQQQYQQQPGMPAPYMQQPGMPAPYMRQQGGFPQVPGLATNARMAAYEVDELPDAYILTNRKSKAKWLIPVLGFLILAAGAAAAAYFLLTQKNDTSSQPATLMVVSTPEGASVTVNGSLLNDKTPTSYSNAHVGDSLTVVVDLKGHRKWESETTLKTPDGKLIARLDPILVNLTVTSEPPGAEIYLNGNASAAGRTPKTFSDIDPATATSIIIKKDGFREARRNLDWTTDTKKEVPFLLQP